MVGRATLISHRPRNPIAFFRSGEHPECCACQPWTQNQLEPAMTGFVAISGGMPYLFGSIPHPVDVSSAKSPYRFCSSCVPVSAIESDDSFLILSWRGNMRMSCHLADSGRMATVKRPQTSVAMNEAWITSGRRPARLAGRCGAVRRLGNKHPKDAGPYRLMVWFMILEASYRLQ